MRKPTFMGLLGNGKRPELQIKILNSIVWSGQLSKKKIAARLHANYSVVSDALDVLLEKEFIKFSEQYCTTGRRPEKFYKITEKGLSALLNIELDPNDFWKAIVLLCASSKISQKEFGDYYHKFEHGLFGQVNTPGYFFLAHSFKDILDQWLETHYHGDTSVFQIIVECLALNGSLTLERLVSLSGAKREEVTKVLNLYSIQTDRNQNLQFNVSSHNIQTLDNQKSYQNFFSHLFIVSRETAKGTEFSLSLFGVLLAISLIRNFYNYSIQGLVLFYRDVGQDRYIDTIAKNFGHKVPLIFGKWELLKSELGTIMLYETFDFLIFKDDISNNIHSSILTLGNKEFYEDIITLSYDAINKLRIVYGSGRHILNGYEKSRPNIRNEPGVGSVYVKVREIEEVLSYAELSAVLQGVRSGKKRYYDSQSPGTMTFVIDDIEKIEAKFGVELCFLFYLNLNTIFFPSVGKGSAITGQKTIIDESIHEVFRLGSPKQRLMAILAKDKEIKQWFSMWIQDIIDFRIKTSKMMSNFCKEINQPQKSINNSLKMRHKRQAEPEIEFSHEEYDMSKICSDISSVYNQPH